MKVRIVFPANLLANELQTDYIHQLMIIIHEPQLQNAEYNKPV